MSEHLQSPDSKEPVLRMVLVGKTGSGKSSSGNTILREKAFQAKRSANPDRSKCQKKEASFGGQSLAVVDTPGLFDTKLSQKEVMTEIGRCMSLSAPGPHVFLVVILANRFTKEEQETVKILQKIFGKESARYTMVLFTGGDNLKEDEDSIEDFIKANQPVSDFISECEGRFHVFNNRDKDPSQVRDLLKKINHMVQVNGGRYFTNEIFEEAERSITEETEKLQRENPNMKPEEARRRAERDNRFIQLFKAAGAGAGAGAGLGAGLGALGGPIGAAVGAVAGAGVGSIVGVVVELRHRKKGCSIQ